MTAAYNEELHIEKTITSVLQQTLRPERWMIVSDGSTDRTNEIIERYASQHDFIRFLRLTRAPGHSFSSKVVALNKGLVLIKGTPFDFIGNLDADVSVGPTYFEQLTKQFETSPQLGLASGFVHEEIEGEFHSRSSNRTDSVRQPAPFGTHPSREAMAGHPLP